MSRVIKLKGNRERVSHSEALQEFLFWKKAQSISDRTMEDYQLHVNNFFKIYPGCWAEAGELKRGVYDYMGQEIMPATYNLRLNYLRAFFQWSVSEGYLVHNPLQGFKRRHAEPRIVNISEEVLQALLKTPNQKTFTGVRDYALILLQLDTGIRPKEALSLKVKDIDLNHLWVNVKASEAKTRQQRSLPILSVTAKAMRKLISNHHPSWEENTTVFCSQDGKVMDRKAWLKRLNIYSDKIGFKIIPYALRHSFALHYIRNGGNVFALQSTLGHSDLQMTKRYVHMTNQDLRDQHTRYSPLNSLTSGQIHRKKKL